MSRPRTPGFTLLELLVVLAVVSLLLSLVAPNLVRLVGSVERATRRDAVVADLANLSYRAHALGQSFELASGSLGRVLADGNPVLALPAGWQAEVLAPVRFAFTGWCSGGTVLLRSPDRTVERVELRAPDCRIAAP
jgi:prepilin-type N-terminal cleavage/methylation domain-containing protein